MSYDTVLRNAPNNTNLAYRDFYHDLTTDINTTKDIQTAGRASTFGNYYLSKVKYDKEKYERDDYDVVEEIRKIEDETLFK